MSGKKTARYIPPMVVKLDAHKVPVMKEAYGKKWVQFGSDDQWKNRYPDYLITLFNRSAKHNAIVTGKVNYIVGKGVEINEENTEKSTADILKEAILHVNPDETLNDLLFKITMDFELFNGIALEVIWNNGKTGWAEIRHVDFSKIRINKEETKYYYSGDWSKYNPEMEQDWVIYEPFNINKKTGRQLFYFKGYRPNLKKGSYPLPDYIGGNVAIETDIQIYNFHYNNIKNNFSAGTIINFNTIPANEEEIKKTEKKLQEKFQGTDHAGEFVLTFSDGKDRAPEIIRINGNDYDKQFITLATQVQEEIFIAHKVTSPMLFGVKTAGQLGGRNELIEANELFENTYCKSKRQIIERLLNELYKINGFEDAIKITQTEPIGYKFSEEKIWEAMTPEERREKLGLSPLEKQPEVILKKKLTPKEAESRAIEMFRGCGISKGEFNIIRSRRFAGFSKVEAVESENELLKEHFAEINIKTVDAKILDLIIKDPLMPPDEIAKALGISEKKVSDSITRLTEDGTIKEGEKKSGDDKIIKRIVSPDAKKKVNEKPIADIEVMWSYEVRSGLGAEIIPTTREFCRELITLDKLYTRKDIERISNEVDRNVWETRGGWYHNPETDVNVPACRHIWVQNVVSRK